jgi:hypothetical protein
MDFSSTGEPAPLPTVRRLLLAALCLGTAGTLTELLFLAHFESALQIAPLALLSAGLVAALVQVRSAAPSALRALQLLMALFVAAGFIGIGLHYEGNSAFELEMYPTLGGLALVGGALTGATPVLAPGTMVLLGVIGLTYTYRHPGLAAVPDTASTQEEVP